MDSVIDVFFELSGIIETLYWIFAIAVTWVGAVFLGKIVKKWR